MKSPKKILIANRGVIAIRALRAAKELGYQVASVYSTIDKDQKHLKLSDEAICIGPAAAKDSYLNEAAIISAAELASALMQYILDMVSSQKTHLLQKNAIKVALNLLDPIQK